MYLSLIGRLINIHMHNWKCMLNATECVKRYFRALIKCTLLVHVLYASSSSEQYGWIPFTLKVSSFEHFLSFFFGTKIFIFIGNALFSYISSYICLELYAVT